MVNNKGILYVLIICIQLFACRHKNRNEFVGPAICPSENFRVNYFNISNEHIDFNIIGYDSITASFNESIRWEVILTGKKSGAIKKYEGKSSTVGIRWYGQSGAPDKLFQTGEEVTVSLNISCQPALIKTIYIVNENRFTDTNSSYLLISDFDGNGYVKNLTQLPGYIDKGWSTYEPVLGAISKFAITNTPLVAPQGNNYLTLTGTPANKQWYAGETYISLPSTLQSSNISNAYLSLFINGGGNSNTLIALTLICNSVSYKNQFPINWKGWKYQQIKLSDFKTPNGQTLTSFGKTNTLSFSLNCSTNAGKETEINIDFVMLSKEGPFFQ